MFSLYSSISCPLYVLFSVSLPSPFLAAIFFLLAFNTWLISPVSLPSPSWMLSSFSLGLQHLAAIPCLLAFTTFGRYLLFHGFQHLAAIHCPLAFATPAVFFPFVSNTALMSAVPVLSPLLAAIFFLWPPAPCCSLLSPCHHHHLAAIFFLLALNIVFLPSPLQLFSFFWPLIPRWCPSFHCFHHFWLLSSFFGLQHLLAISCLPVIIITSVFCLLVSNTPAGWYPASRGLEQKDKERIMNKFLFTIKIYDAENNPVSLYRSWWDKGPLW